MASTLISVDDYLKRVKALVNDVDTVRYTSEQYFNALNVGILEGYNNRPDFYRAGDDYVPQYEIGDEFDTLDWPRQYAFALITFAAGWLELIDAEGNSDQRAAALITSFQGKLRGKL